ncbi:MAG: hexulose-6-phosphate isomerase [Candidatus Poribacteria bacterium]|nr:MAG: hexulose-6-phosphate isomerase [Candidatus Poribacteria bacterium]
MRYGIRDGMLRVPFEERFQKAAELGFDGVELCLGGAEDPHPLLDESGIERIQQLAEAAGVLISSFSPGGFTSYTFTHPDEERRRLGIHYLNRLIRVAPQFGVRAILVPFFGDGKIIDERHPLLVEGLQRTGEVAERYGVTLCVESTLSAEQHLRLLDAVGLDSVKVYYDMGNATNLGYDAPTEIRRLGKQIGRIHMKDTGTPLGEGRVDFEAVAAAIREIGYDDWLVLETPVGDDPDASNRQNLEFVRQLLP